MIDFDALFRETRETSSRNAVRYEWWLRTSRLAVAAQDWPTALDRLARAPDAVQQDPHANTALLAIELACCIGGNLPGRVEGALARWQVSDDLSLLDPVLVESISAANQAAIATATQLTRRVPDYACAWAAVAELHERGENWAAAAQAWKHISTPSAALRFGVAAMHAGDARTGRTVLRGIEPSRETFAWTVLGWLASPKWTDRIRAYDMVADAIAAELRAEPGRRPSMTALRELVRAIVSRLPVAITADEGDRLREVANLAFDPTEYAAAAQTIEARAQLNTDQASGPAVTEADEILAAYEGAPAHTGAAALISSALHDELNLELLDAMLDLDAEQNAYLLALWLSLATYEEALEDRYLRWFADARTPSTGWLVVAEQLFARGAPDAGLATLKRAIAEGDTYPEDLYADVLEHAISHVTQTGSAADIRWWLEVTSPT